MKKSKMFYFFISCIILSIIIIGATFAYFTASADDDKTVEGRTESISFSMEVTKVTDVDNVFGLIPMKNIESINAGKTLCKDINGNAGCQIYKISISTNSDTALFVDGYMEIDAKEGVDTRFTEVLPTKVVDDETGETKTIYLTKYTKEDLKSQIEQDNIEDTNGKDTNAENKYIKTGIRSSNNINSTYNPKDDYNCLFVRNRNISAKNDNDNLEEEEITSNIYVMVWLYDTGENQDIQGMQQMYAGTVTFQTAEGNQIKASFD